MVSSRVLLTGEPTLVLEGLRYCLESELDVNARLSELGVASEAEVRDCDAMVYQFPASHAEGLEQTHRIHRVAPEVALVILADDADPRLAAAAFALGVHGWVLKSSTVPELAAAVRAALGRQRYLTSLVAHGDIDALPEPGGIVDRRARIRPREREVLRLLAEGRVMREIGAELGIAPRTVAFHKYRLMKTLGVKSTAELIQVAVRERIVGPGARDCGPAT